MPIQAVKTRRLYQEVAGQISALIDAGEFSAGERLPSERDLSARFEVSRPTIREAMIALEIQGRVEIRTGSGIYVLARADQAVPKMPDGGADDAGPGPFELIEARLMLEPQAAALAAQRMAAGGVSRLEHAVLEMERLNREGKPAEEADRRFHILLAEATQNSAITQAVELLWDLRSRMPMWKRLHEVISILEQRPNWTDDRRAVDDHRRILNAIRARDGEMARQAMEDHLERVRRVLLRASETGEVF